jgi:hypothetical protein
MHACRGFQGPRAAWARVSTPHPLRASAPPRPAGTPPHWKLDMSPVHMRGHPMLLITTGAPALCDSAHPPTAGFGLSRLLLGMRRPAPAPAPAPSPHAHVAPSCLFVLSRAVPMWSSRHVHPPPPPHTHTQKNCTPPSDISWRKGLCKMHAAPSRHAHGHAHAKAHAHASAPAPPPRAQPAHHAVGASRVRRYTQVQVLPTTLSLATAAAACTSPNPKLVSLPARPRSSALRCSAQRTAALLQLGRMPHTSTADAAAWGVAMDVLRAHSRVRGGGARA